MQYQEAVAQLRGAEAAGFGVSEVQALKLVNRGVKRLAALSRWVKEIRELGPTVADQADYALGDDVLEVEDLSIGGSADYVAGSLDDIRSLRQGTSWLEGDPPWASVPPGAFADSFNAAGAHLITVFETPSESGLAISGYCSVIPADGSGATPIPFPPDFDDHIIDAARAYGYEDIDENPELAVYYHDKTKEAGEILRRRRNSRAGSGPVRIRVEA